MTIQETITPGATVYGADGEIVGTATASTGVYIVVEKGLFFPKDYCIPVSTITDANPNTIFLSVTKDDALDQGGSRRWSAP